MSTAGVAVFWTAAAAGLGLLVFWRRRGAALRSEPKTVQPRHWVLAGLARAGDGLSGAMLLGVCGLISFYGFDGFLYAVGMAAGWFAAVVLGVARTWADDAGNTETAGRGGALAKLMVVLGLLAAELVVAGAVIGPLAGGGSGPLGLLAGGGGVVVMALLIGRGGGRWSAVVRGTLMVVLGVGLTMAVCGRALTPKAAEAFPRELTTAEFQEQLQASDTIVADESPDGAWDRRHLVRVRHGDGTVTIWQYRYMSRFDLAWPAGVFAEFREGSGGSEAGFVADLPERVTRMQPKGPLGYLAVVQGSDLGVPRVERVVDGAGVHVIHGAEVVNGEDLLATGRMPGMFEGLSQRDLGSRVNLVSLMAGLFLGMGGAAGLMGHGGAWKASLSAAGKLAAEWDRRAAAVAMVAAGIVMLASLFVGLGALTSGALDAGNSNRSAGLLAGRCGEAAGVVFSLLALGLMVSVTRRLMAAGADAASAVWRMPVERAGTKVVVGMAALGLGVWCAGMNAAFLTGWVLAIAAAASVPAMVARRLGFAVTRAGVAAGMLAGAGVAAGWILLSVDAFEYLYGFAGAEATRLALAPFNQPAVAALPVAVVVMMVVSWRGPKAPRISGDEGKR